MKALLILTIAILAISGGSISCRNPKHAQTPKSELVRKELNKVLAAANNEDLVQATSDFDQAVENLRKIDADEAVVQERNADGDACSRIRHLAIGHTSGASIAG